MGPIHFLSAASLVILVSLAYSIEARSRFARLSLDNTFTALELEHASRQTKVNVPGRKTS